MFTGIIQDIGSIGLIETGAEDTRIFIQTNRLDMRDVKEGDSIATNGVCLTAVKLEKERTKNGFWADVSAETLSRTTFRHLQKGAPVNLEKALTLMTPLGGHLVSGHVDGIGRVVNIAQRGRSTQIDIAAPQAIKRYIAEKGSICVEGVSLTVNAINDAIFSLNIVPHTLKETTLEKLGKGDEVNLEVDIIARYLERLLSGGNATSSTHETGVTMELLHKRGFL